VEPIDQMHEDNPASQPELLDFLADDFAAHRFDLRHLLRTITNSRAYQLSSRHRAGMASPAEPSWACGSVRPLSAHQTAVALLVAAGHFEASADVGAARTKFEAQYAGTLKDLVNHLSGGAESFQPDIRTALFQTNGRDFSD